MDKVEAYDCWEGVVNGCLEDKDLDDILSILDYPFHGEWDCLGPILPDMDTGPPLLPLSAADADATQEPLCQYPLANKLTDAPSEVVIFNSQSPVSVLQANNNAPSSSVIKCCISKRTRSKRARPSGPNPWLSMLPPSFAATKRARKARRDESLDHVEPLHNRIRKCVHCEVTKTPQWREGPMGPKTLCNACGVRYRSGRLFPEYRPAASPTFIPSMHSNSHRKVIEMRDKTRQAGEIVPMWPDMEFVPTSKYLLKHLGQRKNGWVCFS